MYSPLTRRKLVRGVTLLTAGLIVLFSIIYQRGSLEWLENRTADWRAQSTVDPRRADPRIVIVDIDNASFRALTEKLGRWPWTRQVWAELVRYLDRGKPQLILFDVIFSGSEPGADPGFAQVLREAGNVMAPFSFVSGAVDTSDDVYTPPATAAIRVTGQPPRRALDRREWTINAPRNPLLQALKGSGGNLWTPDPDGTTRRLALTIRYDGKDWATQWLMAAQHLVSKGAAHYQDKTFAAGPIQVPVDDEGHLILRWHGDTLSSYRTIPLWEMICSIYPAQCDASVRRHPPETFRDKLVLVGASAAGSYEVRPTPISETAPGYFAIATAIDNLLHGDGMRPSPRWLGLVLIAAFSVIPAWSVIAFRAVSIPVLLTAAGFVAYGATAWWAYANALWLPLAGPAVASFTSFSANIALRYLIVDRELARTRGTLERYVSPQLVRYVMDRLESFRFDGEKKKLTVFFSDVRGFTTLTERSDPVQLLKQLNEYLEAMTDIIFRYDGIVDKFIGDGIMAHWGAFTPERPNAELAARASLDMIQRLHELNRKWEAAGQPVLDIGIGLNTADVILGNVGTGKKLDFTAIGDGVNLAARLEGANKEYKTNIIMSEFTMRELGDLAQTRPLGSIVVKGKTVGVQIFELLALQPPPARG
ncbi:MAG: CHASE2 domain-containing protein [Bryobacteraceae bacterium]